MNALFSLWTLLPFLDQVVTPQPTIAAPEPSFFALLLILLILFLVFIGFLIRDALKKKK